jgi:hypothetical protein
MSRIAGWGAVGRLAVVVVLTGLCGLVSAALAGAAAAAKPPGSPAWAIESFAYPSNFSSDQNERCLAQSLIQAYENCDTYLVTATNVGMATTAENHTVTLTDAVTPSGRVSVRNVSLFTEGMGHEDEDLAGLEVEPLVRPGVKVCSTAPVRCEVSRYILSHVFGKTSVEPDVALRMYVSVVVDEPAVAGTLVNEAMVAGGIKRSKTNGSVPLEASVRRANTLQSSQPAFGLSVFDAPFVDVFGQPDTQAGAHPYELSTRLGLNSLLREGPEGSVVVTQAQDVRDVVVDLPLGFAGSAVMAPTCPLARLASKGPKGEQGHSGCPAGTIVGHIRSYPESLAAANGSVYNLVPRRGVAAEFGFIDLAGGAHVFDVTLAPTPAGYVVRTSSKEIPQIPLSEVLVNIFGDPAARDKSSATPVPTFTNPEDCNGEPLTTTVHMDSWSAQGSYNADGTPNFADPRWVSSAYSSPPVTGCEALAGSFEPSVAAALSTHQSDSPSGLNVDVSVPQKTGVEELGTPPLRDTTIVLPAGLVVNPSSANGLAACSLEEIGMSGSGVPDAGAPHCPDGSKIGTVSLETPALAMTVCSHGETPLTECEADGGKVEKAPLTGSIYLARQNENPFGSLIAIYIVVDDPRTGVVVKIPAKVSLDPVTGQLTSTVSDTPQFPFSILHTHFFEGSTAALTTPEKCGSYTLTSELTPWSAPASGSPVTQSVGFEVDQSPTGEECSEPGFAPTFAAGTANAQAGAFSPLDVRFSRNDGEQGFASASVKTPAGLLGSIRGIPKCEEPQAAKGECSSESLLGEATTAVGSGPDPYWVHGGKVYLTGPYNGGPFGLAIVVPTTAGPFTLEGNAGFGKEVIRSSIRIDPNNAQITVVSDPFPTILQGIPLQVRTVDVSINRPSFTFNPTSCSQHATEATLTSSQGTTATRTSAFYPSGCASLPFHPVFEASTVGAASKANGANLNVNVTSAGVGQANIAKVTLQLPAALPARLTTLQKACTDTVFNGNPAACNPESAIGQATIHTPILNSSLTGPAYLVSHGGAAFPDVEFVLQGEGITLVLDGKTDIKKGITYSHFESTPDAPFTTFETILPAGPHSALTANVAEAKHFNLCGETLTMPTTITAQDGAVINQTTKVTVQGCAAVKATKTKKLTRAQLLAKALNACRKRYKHSPHKRISCEKRARKHYNPTIHKTKRHATKKH